MLHPAHAVGLVTIYTGFPVVCEPCKQWGIDYSGGRVFSFS